MRIAKGSPRINLCGLRILESADKVGKEQVTSRKKEHISSNASLPLAVLVYLSLNQKDISLEIHPSLLKSFQQDPRAPAIYEDFLHRHAPVCRYCTFSWIEKSPNLTMVLEATEEHPFPLTRRKTRGILSISSTFLSSHKFPSLKIKPTSTAARLRAAQKSREKRAK